MEAALSSNLIKYRHIYGILSLLFCLFAGSGLLSTRFDADPNLYFSEDNEQFNRFRQMQDDYGRTHAVTFVIEIKRGELFTRENLAIVEEFTREAYQLPYAQRVDSLSNYTYTWSKNDELIVEELITDAKELSDEEIVKIKHFALTDAAILNRLASGRGEVTMINMLAQLPDKDKVEAELHLAETAQLLASRMESRYPHIDVLLTGKIINSASINNIVYKDSTVLIPTMFVIIFGLLAVLVRSLSAIFATLIITVVACTSAIGLATHMGIVLNLLSITSINIILTISIAHCAHIIVCFLQAYREGNEKIEALAESYRINIQPVCITSLTTILGFLSMNFSSMPPSHDLGNITALGVLIVFILSFTMLPALIMLFPVSNKTQRLSYIDHANMGRFSDFVIKYQKTLLYGSIIVSALMLILASQNVINDNYIENLKKPAQIRLDNEKIDEYFGGFYHIEYSFSATTNSSISDPEYLLALDSFSQWLREQPEVKNVFSYSDVIKRLNRDMHNGDDSYYRIPDTREEASQYLLLFEISQPSGIGIDHYILPDKSASKLIVALPSVDSLTMKELQARFDRRIKETMPDYMYYPGTGLSIMWAHLGEEVLISSLQGVLFVLFLISALLVLFLKSIRYGIISIIPNIFPMGIGYGIWYLYSGNLDTSQVMVLCITIGIVVDDTIHFISKYLRGRREHQHSAAEAITYTFHRVGAPLWITTAVLVSGFSLLYFSSFMPNSNLGVLTSIILLAALALDFLLLPTLLLWLDKGNDSLSKDTLESQPVESPAHHN